MDSKTLLWIIVAVVVIAIIVAVVLSQNRKRQAESNRAEAAQLRDTSAESNLKLQEQEASAAGAEAEARRVRAEADQRSAEARRLEVEAERRGQDRNTASEEHESTLRRADALDPDVRTDKEGFHLDEDGNRIDDGPMPPTPASPVHEGSDHVDQDHGHEHAQGVDAAETSPSDLRKRRDRDGGGLTG